MKPILCGIETEYGLHMEDSGADRQVEDAMEFVRGCPEAAFVGWDYRFESPRSDLRGFKLSSLAFDPEDAKYDAGKSYGSSADIRSDRVLCNGARFYNDHGHPEYSTPECRSIFELAMHDRVGQDVMCAAARAMTERTGRQASIYKNNTDFHGASYGTHEGYLVPRELGYQKIYDAVTPMLLARQILTGAGKVGAESGKSAVYQLSQRADFFVEPANAETLFRRPIFNTRDEPHGDPRRWIRLHVISGDANMIQVATARKVGLVKLALQLAITGNAPVWKLRDPVQSFQSVSRDESFKFEVALDNRSWTTAQEILESYFAAGEATLELDPETTWVIQTSRRLLGELSARSSCLAREVDWAAKKSMLEQIQAEGGLSWRDPGLQSFDLEYHNPDPDEGLFGALLAMDEVEPEASPSELAARRTQVFEPTRARARSIAVTKFADAIESVSWGSLVLRTSSGVVDLSLPPDADYPSELGDCADVGTFVQALQGIHD